MGKNTIVATIQGGTAQGTFDVTAVAATSQPTSIDIVLYDDETVFWSTATVDDIYEEVDIVRSTIHFGDTTDSLVNYADFYKVVFEKSLLPVDVAEAAAVYTRNVYVDFTYGGKTVRSAPIGIKIRWNEPEGFEVKGPRTLTAGSAVANDQFTVTVFYKEDRKDRVLSDSEFTIRYQNGDVVNFGDEYLYFDYTEGGKEFTNECSLSTMVIIEAPIDAPQPKEYTEGQSNRSVYDAALQTWNFTQYNGTQMRVEAEGLETKDTNPTDSNIAFTGTDAGTYRVTFRAQPGFQFRSGSILAGGETEELTNEAGGTIIVAVTYTWVIEQVDLTGVSFRLKDGTTQWVYDGDASVHLPEELAAKGVGTEATGIDLASAGENGGEVVVTYAFGHEKL